MAKPTLKAEAVRLRVKERLSLREIQAQTGASKGSLSNWLRPYPLSPQELSERKRKPRPVLRKPQSVPSKYFRGGLLSRQKGEIAEAAVLFRLALHGLPAFRAQFDNDKADWVVRTPLGLKTIQVKWASHKKQGAPVCSLRCNEGGSHKGKRPYQEGAFDYLVGYDLYTDTAYVWTWDEVKEKSAGVSISPEAAEAWGKLKRGGSVR